MPRETRCRYLTGFGVDVGSQNVPTRNVFQSKTFGYARRHCSFPRPRRTHNDSTENPLKSHYYLLKVSFFTSRIVVSFPWNCSLDAQPTLNRSRYTFPFHEVRNVAESGRVFGSRSRLSLTEPWLVFFISLSAAEAEERGGGEAGRRCELRPARCQRGQMRTHFPRRRRTRGEMSFSLLRVHKLPRLCHCLRFTGDVFIV